MRRFVRNRGIDTAVLDRTGILASVGCAIHCMVAPVLILVAPTLGGLWAHPLTHAIIAALVLPVAASALWRGFPAHRRRWILIAGMIGMALVALGVVLPWWGPSQPDPAPAAGAAATACCPTVAQDEATGALSLSVPPASIVSILGGMVLVAAHIGNLRCGCPRTTRIFSGTNRVHTALPE